MEQSIHCQNLLDLMGDRLSRLLFLQTSQDHCGLTLKEACDYQAPAGSRIFNPGISEMGFCKIRDGISHKLAHKFGQFHKFLEDLFVCKLY